VCSNCKEKNINRYHQYY